MLKTYVVGHEIFHGSCLRKALNILWEDVLVQGESAH